MKRKLVAITVLMVLLINLVTPTILAVETANENQSTTEEQVIQKQKGQEEDIQEGEQEELQEQVEQKDEEVQEDQEVELQQEEKQKEQSTELLQDEKQEEIKLTSTQTASEEQGIEFESQELKDYFLANYDSNSDGIITETEMLQLETLTINGGLTSQVKLKGLEYAKNLKKLDITANVVDVEDVKEIAQLTNLEDLSISGQSFENLDFLENLTKLTKLNLSNNGIENIAQIGKLTSLESLGLSYNQIKDISSLKTLTNLKNLYLVGNEITDFSVIEELTTLEHFTAHFQTANMEDVQMLKNSSKEIELPQIIKMALNESSKYELNAYTQTTDLIEIEISSDNTKLIVTSAENIGSEKITITLDTTDNNGTLVEETRFSGTEIYLNIRVDEEEDNTKEIEIKNNDLKQQLLNQYDYDLDNKITEYDMAQIENLYIYSVYTDEDLKVIGYAKNLKELSLNLYNVNLTDWSSIYNLEKLETLRISGDLNNKIEFLSSFTKIKNLDLSCSGIEDISSLSGLTNLETLDVSYNEIKDFTCLKNFSETIKNNIIVKGQQVNITLDEYLVQGESTTLELPPLFGQISEIFETTGNITCDEDEFSKTMISDDKKQVIITPLKTNSMQYQYGIVQITGGRLDSTVLTIEYKAIQNIGDTSKEIEILDPNLRMALLKLCDYNEDRKITENEALQLEYLHGISGIVYDWTGIENFKNLKTLYIYQSSLKGLEKATMIEELYLAKANAILSIPDLPNLKSLEIYTPGNIILPADLGKFTKLEYLLIESYANGKIINSKYIGNLTNLQYLHINMGIDDVSQFSKLTKIKELNLYNNNIDDISFAKSMVDLEYIHVEYNNIKEVQGLKDLTKLEDVGFTNNQIEDFTPIKDKISSAYDVIRQNIIKEITEEVDFTNGYEIELPQYFKDILNPDDVLYVENTKIKAENGLEIELIDNSKIKILKNPSDNMAKFTFYQYEGQYATSTLEYRFINNVTKDEEVQLNNPELLEELLKQYDYDKNGKLTTTEANSITYLQITNKNKIKNLNGLEKLSNLIEITIKNGEISDISNIVAIAETMEYGFIDLSNNLITDITPLAELNQENHDMMIELSNNFIDFTEGNANYNAIVKFINDEQFVNIGAVGYYERTQHYGNVADRNKEVSFDSPIKEKLLEMDVDADNDKKITRQELYDMGNFSGINTDEIILDLSNSNLSNVNGLEYFTNLTTLDISNNQITDLEPIGKLTKLQNLNASNNEIKNITPLANCMMLADLDLSNNDITNIEALANNFNMTTDALVYNMGSSGENILTCHVILDNNKIQDISPICKLRNIEYASIKNNYVTDITSLKNFEFLDMFIEAEYGEKIEVDLGNNYIDIMSEGTKEAITHFEDYNSKIYLNDQKSEDIPTEPEDGELAVKYFSHIQDYGWEDEYSKSNGQTSGTIEEGKKVEAIKIKLVNAPQGASVLYKAHVQDIGWEDWVQGGSQSGTTGQNKKVEAMRIKLNNMAGYSVMYRAYVQGEGWQQWVSDGGLAGTTGRNLKLEAIEIKLIKTSVSTGAPTVKYYSHVQDYGWEEEFSKSNGQTSGTIGESKKVEAIKIKLENMPVNGKILYQSHVQDIGWENWVANGEQSGTTGKNKKVEAIKIRLENMAEYSVLYRAYVQGKGWLDWVRDGELAGTTGQNLKLEAIEIKIVERNLEVTPQIQYYSHVQDIGWEDTYSKENGQTSGTIGQAKKLEGIKIKLLDVPEGAKILYKSHVQDIGWEDWKEDELQSGTTGQNKKIEAIRIKLENLDNYSVMYRAYIQGKGWQPWVRDGVITGTTGQNLRLEAIQIKLVDKISITPKVEYYSHIQDYGWEDEFAKSNGETSGKAGEGKKVEAIKIRLEGVPEEAKISYESHVQDIGWEGWTQDSLLSGTTGLNKKVEAIRIKLEDLPGFSVTYRAYVEGQGWQPWVKDGAIAGTTGKNLKLEAIEIKIVSK